MILRHGDRTIAPSENIRPAFSKPPLTRFVLEPLRAGAIVAGGLLAPLGVIWLIRDAIAEDALLLGWALCGLSSLALATWRGYPERPRQGEWIVGRALGAAVYGALLLVGAYLVLAHGFSNADRDPLAIALVLVGGAALIAVGLIRWRAVVSEVPAGPEEPGPGVPAALAREAPGEAYALRGDGPPVDAAEVERDAPALEVEVRWGEARIAVRHLAPPRRFVVGGAGSDLALPEELLGAPERALAVVERWTRAVSVVVPPGATGAVEAEGKRTPLEEALQKSGASLTGSERRLPLRMGARISLVLGGAGGGYRAAAGGGEGRVVIALALVKAGRRVGRAPLAGAGRLLVASAAVALVAAAGLRWSAAQAARGMDAEEDGSISADQQYEIQRRIQAIQERELREEEERWEAPSAIDAPPESSRTVARYEPYWPLNVFEDEDLGEMLPHYPGLHAAVCPERELSLNLYGSTHGSEWISEVRSPFLPVCAAVLEGPLAMRWRQGGPGALSSPRAGPGELWALGYVLGALEAGKAPWGEVALPSARIERLAMEGEVDEAAVDAAVRSRLRAVRLCYRLRPEVQQEVPAWDDENRPGALEGAMDVQLAVGRDGRVAKAQPSGKRVFDKRVEECARRALDGIQIPPPPAAVRLRYRIHLAPP